MTDTLDRLQGALSTFGMKKPVLVATTTNITLSGLQSIDGVTVAEDDRVLVKDQSDDTENGVYAASTGAWARPKDFDSHSDFVRGTTVAVARGTVNGSKIFAVSSADVETIGEDSITFTSALSRGSWRNVKDYGAVGDGSTDDTDAVQAALDVGSTFDHGTVFFPDGTYMVAGLKFPSNCSIKGSSRDNTILKLKNSGNTYILASKLYVENDTANAFPDGQNFIENITFDGNKANNSSGTCLILRSYNAQIMCCDFQNAADHGIIQSAATANGSNAQNAAECVYKQCRIHLNNKRGMWFKDDSNSKIADAWIVDCWIHNNGTDGFVQVDIERGAGFHIHNNQLYDDYQGNIKIAGASGTTMTGNNLELGTLKGSTGQTYRNLEVALGDGSGDNLGIQIVGNIFHTFLADVATNTYKHIDFTGSGVATNLHANVFRAPSGGWTNGAAIDRTAGSAIVGVVGASNFFQNFTSTTRGQGYYDLSRIVAISGDSGATTMTLASVNADAVAGPIIDLDRQSTSPAASDNLAMVRFRGRDSGGGTDDYAYIAAIISSPTSGSESGIFDTYVKAAGTDRLMARLASSGVFFGSSGGNVVAPFNNGALSTAATDGFLYIPTSTAASTAAPTATPTAYTGMVPLLYNTAQNRLWINGGGTWRSVALST